MERMPGGDAMFVYNETPAQHMHTLKVGVVDTAEMPGGYAFDTVVRLLEQRLRQLPSFRKRFVKVPFSIHHPVYIEDPDFRLSSHVDRVRCDPPGGREEFDAVMSRIASAPLVRDRPLWHVTVVEGLEGGRVGFVAKIHHSLADGMMAAEILGRLFDTEPHVPAPAGDDPWVPETIPDPADVLGEAVRQRWRETVRFPRLAYRTIKAFRSVNRDRKQGAVATPRPFAGPKLSFNRSLTPRRLFVTATLPLGEVKQLKSDFGVTVNDMVLSICTGALRRYLSERGELPAKPIVATIPVSARNPGDPGPMKANETSNLFTFLPVHLDDAVARVRYVHEMMDAGKARQEALGKTLLAEWQELTPPGPYRAFVVAMRRLRVADYAPPPVNLVVSNVPGPRQPLYMAGGRLDAIYSMGPILENIGLNITVWSYVDTLFFGVVGVPERSPDLRNLTAHLEDALKELREAAGSL